MSGPVVLQVLAPARFGGLETVVRSLASGLVAAGTEVHVAAVDAPDDTVEWLAESGAPVHTVRPPRRRYDLERKALRALARRVGARVAHTHGSRVDVVAGPGFRADGLGVVSTVHGFTGNGLKNRFYEWLQVRSYRHFDAVLAVSRPLQAALTERVGPDRVEWVPNALPAALDPLPRDEARAALGLDDEGGPDLVWIGRMSPEKDVALAVRALARSKLPDARLWLIGDGPDRPGALETAAELGVDDRVRWLGVVPDAARYLSAFDALVLSSRTEGTPMVMLEADRAGLPVIATAVGGVPDLLGAGPNLVVPGDADALGAALARVAGDPTQRADSVQRARARIGDAYDPTRWIERHRALYERLAGGSALGAHAVREVRA